MFIQMTITASILIVLGLIIRYFFHDKMPKATFLLLWGVVLVRLIFPLAFQTDHSVQGLFTSEPTLVTAPIATVSAVTPAESSSFNWLIPWFLGVMVVMIYFVMIYFKLQRQLRFAIPLKDHRFVNKWLRQNLIFRNIRILVSDQINTPMTTGIFFPKIYLPKQLDLTNQLQLEYILAHELHHIKRFDAGWKLLAVISLCLHWFNPLVWLMAIIANRDLEISCDAAVVKKYGTTVKKDYALTLIGLAEKKRHFTPLYSAFARNAAEERVTAIMKGRKSSLIGLTVVMIGMPLLVFATFATPVVAEIMPTPVATTVNLPLPVMPEIPLPEEEVEDDVITFYYIAEVDNEVPDGMIRAEPSFEIVATVDWTDADGFELYFEASYEAILIASVADENTVNDDYYIPYWQRTNPVPWRRPTPQS